MRDDSRMAAKALVWLGVGTCTAGAFTLGVVAIVDLGSADPVASVAGAIGTLVGLAFTIYALFRRPAPAVMAAGERSVAAGGSIRSAATGDRAGMVAPPTVAPLTTPPGGTVTASGDRSVAAGGDIGDVSTGNV